MSVLIPSCSVDESYVNLSGAVWNTTYSIKYQGNESLADSVQQVLQRIEMSLSPFNAQSVISQVNDNRSATVDSMIVKVFALSKQVNSLSHGAFDPTLSPLINLWGFGYTAGNDSVPSDSVINATMAYVGITDCYIDSLTMHKKSPFTTFNFSAVTKGYGCDEIAAMFRRNGVVNYLVEIGGELALGGNNDRGKPWRVMIDAPVDDNFSHVGMSTIELTDCGVATSGNYRNYRLTAGGKIGHTISATTGRPLNANTLSATVIASDCATADAFATACMAMDCQQALAMIDDVTGVECLLVIAGESDNDEVSVVTSSGFPSLN